MSEERILLRVAGADRGATRRQPDGDQHWLATVFRRPLWRRRQEQSRAEQSRAEQSSRSDDNEEQLVREKGERRRRKRDQSGRRAEGRGHRCGNGSGRGDKTIEGELTKAVSEACIYRNGQGSFLGFAGWCRQWLPAPNSRIELAAEGCDGQWLVGWLAGWLIDKCTLTWRRGCSAGKNVSVKGDWGAGAGAAAAAAAGNILESKIRNGDGDGHNSSTTSCLLSTHSCFLCFTHDMHSHCKTAVLLSSTMMM
jgi:hypothetical protein